mmetsp:Transcript_23778/g.60033  ORF Transcript_23778/g.60033 Transcript_23778/m.60033 type:complete len:268 (+) Transcript_23778:145-948(+)
MEIEDVVVGGCEDAENSQQHTCTSYEHLHQGAFEELASKKKKKKKKKKKTHRSEDSNGSQVFPYPQHDLVASMLVYTSSLISIAQKEQSSCCAALDFSSDVTANTAKQGLRVERATWEVSGNRVKKAVHAGPFDVECTAEITEASFAVSKPAALFFKVTSSLAEVDEGGCCSVTEKFDTRVTSSGAGASGVAPGDATYVDPAILFARVHGAPSAAPRLDLFQNADKHAKPRELDTSDIGRLLLGREPRHQRGPVERILLDWWDQRNI